MSQKYPSSDIEFYHPTSNDPGSYPRPSSTHHSRNPSKSSNLSQKIQTTHNRSVIERPSVSHQEGESRSQAINERMTANPQDRSHKPFHISKEPSSINKVDFDRQESLSISHSVLVNGSPISTKAFEDSDLINQSVEREKEILISEFKTLGVKLRKLKDADNKSQASHSERFPDASKRAASVKRGSVATDYHRRDSIIEKQDRSLQHHHHHHVQSVQCQPRQSIAHNPFQSVQSNRPTHHHQSQLDHPCLDPLSCCYHGFSTQSQHNHPSSTHHKEPYLHEDSIASYRQLETAEFDYQTQAESKKKFLTQLELQIQQIQGQIKKNEEILLKKKREIHQADEILKSKRSYLAEELDHEPLKDSNACYYCSKGYSTNPMERYSVQGQSVEQEAFKIEQKKFIAFARETEARIKKEEAQLIEEKHRLQRLEKEIEIKNMEIQERQEKLNHTELEFENLAKRLEDQSQELLKQKAIMNQKMEAFTATYERFQLEKKEFNDYEKEFQKKNLELKLEKDRLSAQGAGVQRERSEIERQNYEMRARLEELEKTIKFFDQKESSIIQREKALEEKCEELRSEIERFKQEKDEFAASMIRAEQILNEKEKQLEAKELLVNQNKEYFDDFELKLQGLRMNEEQWQKKRDFEIENLLEDIKRLKEKEITLAKKEEKLLHWEDKLRKEEAAFKEEKAKNKAIREREDADHDKENIFNCENTSSFKKETKDQNFSFHNDLNDKYLVPLSNRSNRDHHSCNMSDLLK